MPIPAYSIAPHTFCVDITGCTPTLDTIDGPVESLAYEYPTFDVSRPPRHFGGDFEEIEMGDVLVLFRDGEFAGHAQVLEAKATSDARHEPVGVLLGRRLPRPGSPADR
jgi:hypothetical protein